MGFRASRSARARLYLREFWVFGVQAFGGRKAVLATSVCPWSRQDKSCWVWSRIQRAIYMHAYIPRLICVFLPTSVYVDVCRQIHPYVRPSMHAFIFTFKPCCIPTYMQTCMHTCTLVYSRVRLSVCLAGCLSARMYGCMYVCMYVRMYVCMYVCMCHFLRHANPIPILNSIPASLEQEFYCVEHRLWLGGPHTNTEERPSLAK